MGKFMVSFVPGKEGYRVFADDNRTSENVWDISVPIRVQAMVACAGQTLYLAGPPDVLDPEDPWGAAEGRKGGIIWAVSARDGSKKAEYKIDAPPVFDGMIASGGRLYISSMDGRVICLGN
jgi:outer membrane protein assembly factor BamB